MKKISVENMVLATGGKLISGSGDAFIEGASIDSRKVEKGDLFAAIRGENTDGHKYLKQAAEKGAACLLISDDSFEMPDDVAVILVEDTVKGLQDIARAYRMSLDMKVIGVTGSVGKTSTSDMVKAVCSVRYRTQKTKGNFNNHIGLPLTLLDFDPDTEVGILEMGMDKLGEIDFLAGLARPDIGVITNIGTAHIERLGSRDNIFRAKMEITNYFGEGNVLIVNGDDDFLCNVESEEYDVIRCGLDDGNDYLVRDISKSTADGVSFVLDRNDESVQFELPVPGRHNASNAALAAACGGVLGIGLEDAAAGLGKMQLTDKRLTMKEKDGIKVIDDTYNASPASMKSAIEVLASMEGERKVAVLGDMFEQGDYARQGHTEVGEYALEKGIDLVVAIGDDAKYIAEGAKGMDVMYFREKKDFLDILDDVIRTGDVVLCKGSRGMAMEDIVKKIME